MLTFFRPFLYKKAIFFELFHFLSYIIYVNKLKKLTKIVNLFNINVLNDKEINNMAMTKKDFIEKMDAALSNIGEKVLRKSVTNFSYKYNNGFIGFETKSGRSLSYDRWSGVIKDIDVWNDINRSHFTVSPDDVDQSTWIKICAEANAAADKASFVAKC